MLDNDWHDCPPCSRCRMSSILDIISAGSASSPLYAVMHSFSLAISCRLARSNAAASPSPNKGQSSGPLRFSLLVRTSNRVAFDFKVRRAMPTSAPTCFRWHSKKKRILAPVSPACRCPSCLLLALLEFSSPHLAVHELSIAFHSSSSSSSSDWSRRPARGGLVPVGISSSAAAARYRSGDPIDIS